MASSDLSKFDKIEGMIKLSLITISWAYYIPIPYILDEMRVPK